MRISIVAHQIEFKKVDHFKFHVTIITENNYIAKEVAARIQMANNYYTTDL